MEILSPIARKQAAASSGSEATGTLSRAAGFAIEAWSQPDANIVLQRAARPSREGAFP